MNKAAAVAIILVLLVGGFFLFRNETSAPTDTEVKTEENVVQQGINVGEPNPSIPTGADAKVKEFTVDASNFAFSMKSMNVKEGDTVRITLNNREGMHDLKIDELSVATRILKVGESQTIEFVADKKGSFEYYCSIGQHRQMGMVGTIVVE